MYLLKHTYLTLLTVLLHRTIITNSNEPPDNPTHPPKVYSDLLSVHAPKIIKHPKAFLESRMVMYLASVVKRSIKP